MTYELWNTQTGNAIGAFDSEADALATVRALLERRGRGYADRLALGYEDDCGRSMQIAEGQELAARALAMAAAERSFVATA
jgi:hypothetical protein